jgi:hypothetical protein
MTLLAAAQAVMRQCHMTVVTDTSTSGDQSGRGGPYCSVVDDSSVIAAASKHSCVSLQHASYLQCACAADVLQHNNH